MSVLGICWQVVIEKQKLHVGVKGQPAILDGEMYAAVKPDDSFWNSDGTALEITLQKVSPVLRQSPMGCGMCSAVLVFCNISFMCFLRWLFIDSIALKATCRSAGGNADALLSLRSMSQPLLPTRTHPGRVKTAVTQARSSSVLTSVPQVLRGNWDCLCAGGRHVVVEERSDGCSCKALHAADIPYRCQITLTCMPCLQVDGMS